MKLIHSNKYGEDQGIIQDFDFDLAYGQDENNFELTLSLPEHCCDYDDIVYIVDVQNGSEVHTEYGGIIDSIKVNTDRQEVVYKGRTWHGVLAGKILMPEEGQDYYTVSGNANGILSEVIVKIGLDLTFTVPQEQSPINIVYYQFPRYVDAYTGLRNMLAAFGGKLNFRYNGHMAEVSAVWLTDYSQDDEWDSTQVGFQVESAQTYVNHLICLGSGELKDRRIIHLFTDEAGGVQPYATTDKPIQDSDYILNEDNQKILWSFEVCDVLDYPNAQDTDNYVKLTTQPSDWDENFMEYYYLDANQKYKNIEFTEDREYKKLEKEPDDWSTNYAKYFTSSHKSVEGTATTTYTKLTAKPADWDQNYANYYVKNGSNYDPVSYTASVEYQVLTEEPSDWQSNYGTYYRHKVNSEIVQSVDGGYVIEDGYVKVRKSGDGYELIGGSAPPDFVANRYYKRSTQSRTPKFGDGVDKYKMTKTVAAPTWQADTYYKATKDGKIPSFKSGVYYRLVVDHYADLVKKGLERLKDIAKRRNSIKINLDLQGEYDIGDIVGAREETTGIEVWQPIVKKIVKIDKRGKTISYKIGEKSQ